jgi:hypothetical protein
MYSGPSVHSRSVRTCVSPAFDRTYVSRCSGLIAAKQDHDESTHNGSRTANVKEAMETPSSRKMHLMFALRTTPCVLGGVAGDGGHSTKLPSVACKIPGRNGVVNNQRGRWAPVPLAAARPMKQPRCSSKCVASCRSATDPVPSIPGTPLLASGALWPSQGGRRVQYKPPEYS